MLEPLPREGEGEELEEQESKCLFTDPSPPQPTRSPRVSAEGSAQDCSSYDTLLPVSYFA